MGHHRNGASRGTSRRSAGGAVPVKTELIAERIRTGLEAAGFAVQQTTHLDDAIVLVATDPENQEETLIKVEELI